MNQINIIQKKLWSFADIREKVIKKSHDNSSVLGESARINTRRIYYLGIISIPLRIVYILLFTLTKSYDTLILKKWSQGIIASHFVLLIFMIGFFSIALKLKNKPEVNTTMLILQYVVVSVIMASGIVIVTLDQLVTSNIMPFLLSSIVTGSVFLIRPLTSLIIYLTSYVVYYISLGLTITDPQLLLSNRVNGATAVGIGFLMSILMWHYNYISIIQERRIEKQQKQLEKMAYYDPLTDLPNRRMLDRMIKGEFSSIEYSNHETVIMILDVDNFKKVNDTYGHPAGDSVLKQLADLIKNSIRESDTVFRFGGEEFIILFPRTSIEAGCAFAERLRKVIMEKTFTVGASTLQITCSLGVSLLDDLNSEILGSYYFLADRALYSAKKSGKNRVEVACGRVD